MVRLLIIFYSSFLIRIYSESFEITNNENFIKTTLSYQDINGKKIKTSVYKILDSQTHPNFQYCSDPKVSYIYVFTSRPTGNDTADFSVYLINLENQKIHMLAKDNYKHNGVLNHVICYSELLIFTILGKPGFWISYPGKAVRFYDSFGLIKEIKLCHDDLFQLAILSDDNTLHHLNLRTNVSFEVSKSSSKPQWSKTELFYMHNDKGTATLKLFTSKFKISMPIMANVLKFNISENLVWILMKKHNHRILTFFIHGDFKDARFENIIIDDILNIMSINKTILVVLKERNKNTTSVWLAETKDLSFQKISSTMLGLNWDNKIDEYDSFQIDYHVDLIKKLTGIIYISQLIRYDRRESKFTAISYNHGNTFIPLQYITKTGLCEWPRCRIYIPPKNDSITLKIITAENNPLLMISMCVLVEDNREFEPRLMISRDGGYSWVDSIYITQHTSIEFEKMASLNDGEVLIGAADKLYYSFDLGNSWVESKFNPSKYNTKHLIKGHKMANFKFLAFTFSNKKPGFDIVVSDFSEIFEQKCQIKDYKIYTPGRNALNSCFHGREGYIYTKTSTNLCQSALLDLPKIQPKPCICTPEDYKCPIGSNFFKGKCLIPTDRSVYKHYYDCDNPSEFMIAQTKPQKFEDNICIEDPTKVEELEICRFNKHHPTITIYSRSKLMFVDLLNEKKIPTLFSKELQMDDQIINFKFDKYKKCIYFHVRDGIKRKCYGSNKELSRLHILIIENRRINSIDLDPSNHYLYYHDKHTITVTDTATFVKMTIYHTDDVITFLKVDMIEQYIYICCVLKDTNDIQIRILTVYGQQIHSLNIPRMAEEIKKFGVGWDVYTDQGVFRYIGRGRELNKINNATSYLNYIRVDFSDQFITTHGYNFMNYFVLFKNIKSGNIEGSIDHAYPQSCRFSHCEYFCFPKTTESFVCGCPDGMKLNENTQKCECSDGGDKCTICRSDEFYCKNRQCIPKKYVCNDIDDCGDGSDEKSCIQICHDNQFWCMNDKKCISLDLICNGVDDCSDGSDEVECAKHISFCKENEFECLNELCIPKDNVCDSQNDCGDWSDENRCIDKKCEDLGGYCDDGTCIPHSQLCDDVFHCLDFSDERACNPRTFIDVDISCLIKCDDQCIPLNKICDHITDCEDYSDEESCGFEVTCPISKPKLCADKERCYHESEKCDGFNDCFDRSDEINCPDPIVCVGNEFITCDGNSTICISRVCDGFKDCDDGSDEGDRCNENYNIRHIFAYAMGNGRVFFTWDYGDSSTEFDVVINSSRLTTPIRKTVVGNTIEIDQHIICERYYINIFSENRLIKYLKYMYLDSRETTVPYNLEYNFKDKVLKWEANIPPCQSLIYYIECYEGLEIVARNFSNINYLKQQLNLGAICRVSTCPKSVFNISCSSFSRDIIVRDIPTVTMTHAVFVATVIFVIITLLFLIGYFVLRKYFRIKSFEQLTFKNIKFRSLVKKKRTILLSSLTSQSEGY